VDSGLTADRAAALGSAMVLDAFGGVVFISCACLLALSTIACCFVSSLASMGTRSDGTGVLSLKLSANFLRSLSFTALFSRAKALWRSEIRNFSAAENCLKESSRSCSTLVVASCGRPAFLGGMAATPDLIVLLGFCSCSAIALCASTGFDAGLGASLLDSCVLLGSGAAAAGAGAAGLATRCVDCEAGRATEDEIMAGSTGAPGTVASGAGARRAGGVYRLDWPLDRFVRSRRTPLYLSSSSPLSSAAVYPPRSSRTCELVALLPSISRAIFSARASRSAYCGSFLLMVVV